MALSPDQALADAVARTAYPQRRVAGDAVSWLELVTLPSAPFWGRRHTQAVLRSWRLGTEVIDDAELLVSELVTNAVRFSGSHAGRENLEGLQRISLVLRLVAGDVIIEVSDPNPQPPVAAEADGDAEGGRGLMLVQALSKDWGYYLPHSGGKVVYCVLPT